MTLAAGDGDFSQLSLYQREQIDKYIDRLTDDQVDRLSTMSQEELSKLFPEGYETGLGFFWIIIQVAYMAYAAKQAKDKKDKAKKAAAAATKKAKEQADKDKKKLADLNKEMNALDKLKAGQPIAALGTAATAIPWWFVGTVAFGLGMLYLLKRKKRR